MRHDIRHLDYNHYNPIKQGYVAQARDWLHSTFHRFVREVFINRTRQEKAI
jgi:hypothetical protein